jgi:hypothetical protein
MSELDLPLDAGAPARAGEPCEHTLRIRDLRLRFGAPEVYAAECSCGWTGAERHGRMGERLARREGREHTEAARLARFAPRPGAQAST